MVDVRVKKEVVEKKIIDRPDGDDDLLFVHCTFLE